MAYPAASFGIKSLRYPWVMKLCVVQTMNFHTRPFPLSPSPALEPRLAVAVPGAFDNDRPHGVCRSFVQRCLGDKGFDHTGWN